MQGDADTPLFSTTAEPGRLIVTARGRTGSELFAAASAAYFSSVCLLSEVRPTQAYELGREASTLDELFLGWMNDLVWVFSDQEVACAHVTFSHWSPSGYAATLLGEPIDPDRHEPDDFVEAASADGLELDAAEGAWSARVILLT
ncbi:MAG: archease [Gaiellaceae bacterium]